MSGEPSDAETSPGGEALEYERIRSRKTIAVTAIICATIGFSILCVSIAVTRVLTQEPAWLLAINMVAPWVVYPLVQLLRFVYTRRIDSAQKKRLKRILDLDEEACDHD